MVSTVVVAISRIIFAHHITPIIFIVLFPVLKLLATSAFWHHMKIIHAPTWERES